MRRRGKVWKNGKIRYITRGKKRDRDRDKEDIKRRRRLEREKTKPVDR
jgi:hypothetical protein